MSQDYNYKLEPAPAMGSYDLLKWFMEGKLFDSSRPEQIRGLLFHGC